VICYTAIFGPYEEIKEPLVITPGWEYIVFTDQDFRSSVWNVIKAKPEGSPLMEARRYKILFPEFEKSIWVDGSFTINTDLNKFWERFESPMTVSKHPWRKNIGDEIRACIKSKRCSEEGLRNQLRRYAMLDITDYPVISSGILMREDTPEVREFCKIWFSQLEYSTRDQIGFAYAESQMPIVNRMKDPVDYRSSREFIFKTHFNRR
jgi:hypothetical protein